MESKFGTKNNLLVIKGIVKFTIEEKDVKGNPNVEILIAYGMAFIILSSPERSSGASITIMIHNL